MKKIVSIAALAGLAVAANAQSITLERISTIDFTGQIVGQGIGSVAWNGTDLFVGGYVEGGAPALVDAGVTKAANALSSPAFSTFATQQTLLPSNAGIRGLSISPLGLGVFHRTQNNTALTNNIRVYDPATGTLVGESPSTTTIGGTFGDTAFDPINGGLAVAQFGGGRFRQFDPSNGNVIWDATTSSPPNGGPFAFDGRWGTAFQGMDIDDSGNIYVREGQQVIYFPRTGANTVQIFAGPDNSNILNDYAGFSASAGDNNLGQNLAFLDGFDAVIWNDRTSTAGGQLIANILKVSGKDGSEFTLNFANSPSDFLTSGFLDFSYDAASGTLAISDFSSNRVSIYRVTPTPGALGVLGLGGLIATRRRRA